MGCTTSRIPVNILWVVRSIEEFSIFSTELADAQRAYKHFKAKAWVTLSSIDASDRTVLLRFDNFNASVQTSIRNLNQRQRGPLQFVLDQPGMTGASNAAVMALSIVFALVAFALASKVSNNESHEDTVQDFISLMELSMVTLFVFSWILIVIITRRVLLHLRPWPKQGSGLDNTINTHAELGGSESGSDMEDVQTDKEVLHSMVQGKIGDRPNISKEFSSFAKTLSQKLGRPIDISVLACGPPQLIESINDYVNVPSSIHASGINQDHQVTFSFVEEDWEW